MGEKKRILMLNKIINVLFEDAERICWNLMELKWSKRSRKPVMKQKKQNTNERLRESQHWIKTIWTMSKYQAI